MINCAQVTAVLPNGDVRVFDKSISALECAASISPALASAMVAAKVNDQVVDASVRGRDVTVDSGDNR